MEDINTEKHSILLSNEQLERDKSALNIEKKSFLKVFEIERIKLEEEKHNLKIEKDNLYNNMGILEEKSNLFEHDLEQFKTDMQQLENNKIK